MSTNGRKRLGAGRRPRGPDAGRVAGPSGRAPGARRAAAPPVPPVPLDVDQVMEALARRVSGPVSWEAMPLEVGFEIRRVFPDSKLLVGVELDEGEDRLEMDILGLVDGKKLAVRLSDGVGSRAECFRALADVQRLCAVEPDLAGLALAIVNGTEMPENIGAPWPAWRSCHGITLGGRAGLNYAFTWVAAPAQT